MIKVNSTEYRISRSTRDGDFKAYKRKADKKYAYVASAKTRGELEAKLKGEPQPINFRGDDDIVHRLTTYDLKTLEHINKGRILNGLEPLSIKVRTCLKCSQQFESSGNRICGMCRANPRFRNGSSIQGREFL